MPIHAFRDATGLHKCTADAGKENLHHGLRTGTTTDDLAVAIVTDQGHESYVTYSREWRQVNVTT